LWLQTLHLTSPRTSWSVSAICKLRVRQAKTVVQIAPRFSRLHGETGYTLLMRILTTTQQSGLGSCWSHKDRPTTLHGQATAPIESRSSSGQPTAKWTSRHRRNNRM